MALRTSPVTVPEVANVAPDLAGLAAGMPRIEAALLAAVQADDPFLTEVASHLIRAGGKRQRPAFAVAAALTGSERAVDPSVEAVTGGVAVELVHLGSLYHDDVMDEAVIRRTVDSVNARWGNLRAILAGDYLLAKASELAASLGTEVAALLAATIGRLCEGQVAELQDAFNPARTEQRYFASIAGKTSALFATACRIGAIVGDLPRDRIDDLTRFGDRYGMAFQVVDDILDLVASDEELGKPAAHDLVEGTYTLPVLRALGSSGGDELRAILGRPLDDGERLRARDIVRSNGAVPAAVQVASGFVDEAIAALGPAADTEAGAWLEATARGLLDRVS